MKQFQVLKKVTPMEDCLEVIEADYMKLEGGHLIFRKEIRGDYPETVCIFAPGAWAEFRYAGDAV